MESSFTVFTDIDQNPIQTDNNPAHFDCLLWGCPPSKWTILRENLGLGFTIKFKFTDTVQPQAQIAANQLKSLFGILQDFILGTNGCASRGGAQGLPCWLGAPCALKKSITKTPYYRTII